MNREDIIRMALEVGLPHWYHTNGIVNEERVIAFASLVASAEREACAEICELIWGCNGELRDAVEAIRARGQE